MAKGDKQSARGALRLLEESVGVLRRGRAGTLGCYYIGSLPFVLVLLYFLTDMSQNAFGSERLIQGSAAAAAAFVWMKFWHAVFAGRLMEQLCGRQPQRWGPGRIIRITIGQAAIQPWGLILIPLASLALVPLPWIYAFFQNASVYGNGRTDHPGGKPLTSAWRQARIWPKQNIAGLLVLLLFGVFVLVDLGHAVLLPPELAKMFLDIDTVFTRGGFSSSNTTFLAILFSLAYLCIDPLIKAFYTLRCFYGQSLRTGQDLRGELRGITAAGAGAMLVGLVLLGAPGSAGAQEPPPTTVSPRAEISPRDLNESFDEVLAQRKYAWRLRRADDKADADEEKTFATSVVETIWGWIKAMFEWLGNVLEDIWDFLFPKPDRRSDRIDWDPDPEATGPGRGGGESGWVSLLRYLVYAAIAGVAVILGVALWRRLKLSHEKDADESDAEGSPIDLEDENVTADDLPESGWLALAKKLVQQGDARLALRAMYLASLAMLADNNRISIARFKSNMDYRRELDRRCHSTPLLLEAFGRNVGAFEAVWYGTHEATERMLNSFIENQNTIGRVIENA